MREPLRVLADRTDPLSWTCPTCVAGPRKPCVARDYSLGDIGTHGTRVRLALYFEYNPKTQGFPPEALEFATGDRTPYA